MLEGKYFPLLPGVQLFGLLHRMILAGIIQSRVFAAEPSFRVPEINVTKVQGETAVLPCSIQFLGKYKVAWTDEDGFLLSLDDRRIIDDVRMSVERPQTKDWNLHIRDVQYSDRGKYICQIGTTPVKHKHVVLTVLVPPKIDQELSSDDKVVQEGETVTLTCNATGVPPPQVSWYRLSSYPSANKQEKIGSTGEVLRIHNVSRDCGGTYVCAADNGIATPMTRKMKITVEFPPEVHLPAARIGQYPGKETFLQCEVTAHPHGVMFWSRNGVDVALDKTKQKKYTVEMFQSSDLDEKKILSLRIRQINQKDYGRYVCVAENPLGNDKETMLLYDYSIHVRKTTSPAPEVINPRVEYTTQPKANGGTIDVVIPGANARPVQPFDRNKNNKNRKNNEGYDRMKGSSAGSSLSESSISSALTILFSIACVLFQHGRDAL